MRRSVRLSRGHVGSIARGRCRGARPCVFYYPLLCVVKRLKNKLSLFFALPCASCARRDTASNASCGPRGGQEREAHEASLGSGSGAAAR